MYISRIVLLFSKEQTHRFSVEKKNDLVSLQVALEILKRILQVEHTCHFPNLNPISGFIPKILRFYVILAFIAGQESGTF